MRRLLKHIQGQRSQFLFIFILTLAASGLVALQPWPMKLLVDSVLGSDPLPGPVQKAIAQLGLAGGSRGVLALIVAGGVALFVLNAAADASLTWMWTRAGRRAVYELAEEMFYRLQRRSMLFHSRQPVGDTMSRITVDCWALHKVIDSLLFAPAHALLTMGAMILLMSQLDITLTWIALATAPLMVAASFLMGGPLRAAARLKREIESRIQSHLQQTLTGIPIVQAFTQEEREQQQFERFADAAIRVQQRSTLIGSVNSLTSGLITTAGTGIILYVGAHHVAETNLSIGSLLVFLFYLNALQSQMKTVAGVWTTAQGLSASVNRVVEVLEAAPEIGEKPDASDLKNVRGQVAFERVTFSYKANEPILRDITFSTRAGERIAIVGPTGAGKSTLVNLIPRLLDPDSGRVTIDGRDVRDVRLKSLRAAISIVPQEPFLFPFTVADNIAYGTTATRGRIEEAARAANAHEFILGLPKGYDTVIGERGATLSGGERQRLSIARALLKNAPILILDEPTSAVDATTEQAIIESLDRLMAGRTTFIIAHRLSTIQRAERILVLDRGEIVESGSHAELLERGGAFARLRNASAATP